MLRFGEVQFGEIQFGAASIATQTKARLDDALTLWLGWLGIASPDERRITRVPPEQRALSVKRETRAFAVPCGRRTLSIRGG